MGQIIGLLIICVKPTLVSTFTLVFCLICLFHGVIPDYCLASVIIPIVKDKNKDLQDVNNYRPIAVASTISKLFKSFILHQINPFLQTAHNQFGFKEQHSSDMSVFLLKQTINSYVESNTCVFSVFLDATKAFDRVNHYKLFKKLNARHVPTCFVHLLQYWYAHQTMQVKWGNRLSESFLITNGVRQGGVLSPYLFAIYIDNLSINYKLL